MKGGAILKKVKKEEIKTASAPQPSSAPLEQGAPIVMRSMVRSSQVPNLVQPGGEDLFVRPLLPAMYDLTKRSSGKGAHHDAPDVRHHVVHSLSRHPRLLKAYLKSSIAH